MRLTVLRKRSRMLLAVAFVSLIAVLVSMIATATPVKMCQVADRWVSSNRTRLPSTVAGLLSLPSEYRKRTFGALTPTEKSNVIRAYYRAILQDNPLDSQQKEVIEEAIAYFSPDLYSQPPNLSRETRMARDELMRKLAEVLPVHSRKPFLEAPGRTNYFSLMSLETHAVTQLVQFQEALHSRSTADASALFCNCTSDVWCFPQPCVSQSQNNCYPSNTCGYDGNQACWGMCY